MTSEKQIEANRANAQQSKGPTTDAGRKRSRLNALRHGLTGQVTTMTEEDRAAHDTLSKALMKDLAPEGAMETQLAQRVATDSWRLNRASAIEDNLFALGQLQNGGQACPDVPRIDAASTPHPLRAAHQPVHPEESRPAATAPGHAQSLTRSRHEGNGRPPPV